MSQPDAPRRPTLRAEITQVVFGPWPLRPLLLGILTFVALQYGDALNILRSGELSPAVEAVPANLAQAVLVVLPMWILGFTYQRLRRGRDLTRTAYLVIIAITAVFAGGTRYLEVPHAWNLQPGLLAFFIIRAAVLLLIIEATFGLSDARLRRQIRLAEQATEMVQMQRSAVLNAEERARRSIAALLHDRVQAGLLAAMLQLRQLASRLPSGDAATIESVVADLESIRSQDVREAGRRLSPDLRNVPLSAALRDLASTYEPSMSVNITDEIAAEDWPRDDDRQRLKLAIYRIVEQGLLNAAAHGVASNVEVHTRSSGAWIVVSIDDDGRGLPQEPLLKGTGSAVIDAWASIVGGSWTLVTSPLGGARLEVYLHRA